MFFYDSASTQEQIFYYPIIYFRGAPSSQFAVFFANSVHSTCKNRQHWQNSHDGYYNLYCTKWDGMDSF